MNKGLFDLTAYESMKEDDLMSMKLTEGAAEFQDHCPSMDPTQHFDADNSGNKQIPVPGGDKETPTAKPEGGEQGPAIPGGDKETPNAKPADGEQKIPTPAKVTLTADEYNAALDALQKSFKEGYEIMDTLRSATVITESVEDLQKRYTEDAIGTAILDSFENGPMFEKVDRSDKNDVKRVVGNLRSKVADALAKDKVEFYKPNLWARILVGGALTFASGVGAGTLIAGLQEIISARLWQVLGICHMEEGNITKYTEDLTKKFADELGDYKILSVKVMPTLADLFKSNFGWKNSLKTFMLLVDNKLPSEINEAQEALAKEVEKGKKEAEKDKGGKK